MLGGLRCERFRCLRACKALVCPPYVVRTLALLRWSYSYGPAVAIILPAFSVRSVLAVATDAAPSSVAIDARVWSDDLDGRSESSTCR